MRSLIQYMSILFLVLFFHSCSKIDDSTEMNITIQPDTTVANLPIIMSLDTGITISTIPFKFDIDSLIKHQNSRFSKDNITTLRLNSFQIISGVGDTSITFANYENLRLTIQGNGKTSNLLASLNPADAKVKTLTIPVTATDNDLKTFVNGGVVSYTLKGRLRRATTKIHPIKVVSTYRVTMKL